MLCLVALAAGLAPRDPQLPAGGALQNAGAIPKPTEHLEKPPPAAAKPGATKPLPRVLTPANTTVAIQMKRADKKQTDPQLPTEIAKVKPGPTLKPACVAMKQRGALDPASQDLANELLSRFSTTKLVLIVPGDPFTAEGYDAERQYARTLLEWPPVKANQIALTTFVTDTQAPEPPLPPADADTLFILIGIIDEDWGMKAVDALKKRGSSVLAIHDSLCFGCGNQGSGGCPKKHGVPVGCPNLQDDVLSGHPDDLERFYFTPWGSEQSTLYPEKTSTPTMFIDATKDWTRKETPDDPRDNHLSAKGFVEGVRAAMPEVQLIVLGDDTISTPGITHYLDRLPRDQFQGLLRTSWFFVTGITSSYELSLSDAAMSGAVLIDIANASKSAVRPSTTVGIGSEAELVPAVQDAVHRYVSDDLAATTRTWAVNFHSAQYLWLNLLCGLHADTNSDRLSWSKQLYGLNDDNSRVTQQQSQVVAPAAAPTAAPAAAPLAAPAAAPLTVPAAAPLAEPAAAPAAAPLAAPAAAPLAAPVAATAAAPIAAAAQGRPL